MRTLLKVVMPVEPGHQAIRDAVLPATVQSLIDANKPEASCFYAENGKRTMLFVLDLKDPAQIPELAKPLFQTPNAEVQFSSVMYARDLRSDQASGRERERVPVEV